MAFFGITTLGPPNIFELYRCAPIRRYWRELAALSRERGGRPAGGEERSRLRAARRARGGMAATADRTCRRRTSCLTCAQI